MRKKPEPKPNQIRKEMRKKKEEIIEVRYDDVDYKRVAGLVVGLALIVFLIYQILA